MNVVGFTVDEYAEVVRRLDGSSTIAAFELNLSCPNTSAGGIEFGADSAAFSGSWLPGPRCTTLPLMKLSPLLPDIARVAVVERNAGADAVSAVNTIPGILYGDTGGPRLGHGSGGVSGPPLLPVGVLAVSRILDRTGGIPAHSCRWSAIQPKMCASTCAPAHRWWPWVPARWPIHELPERIVRDLEGGGG